jgi:hypothetical protein
MATGHWATIEAFLTSAQRPGWVIGEDGPRVASYDIYEAIFWTAPKSFTLTLRGQEGQPVYIPSGRDIVETAHQYMAPRPTIVVDPITGTGDDTRALATQIWSDFAKRERFYSKFSSNKRDGLMKGDWLWHLFADPLKPDGSRISIFPVDPSLYFPEYLNDDIGTIIAVHLVEPLIIGGEAAVAKLTYSKATGLGGPSNILQSFNYYKATEWGQPGTDMVLGNPMPVTEVIIDADGNEQKAIAGYTNVPLPDQIQALPVYHIPNQYDPQFGWGSSEMRGIESIMRAINQAATDEDITLALEGLGLYVTSAGEPITADGEPAGWNLGPARVVEVPEGDTFTRVNGSGSIAPYQDHLRYLHDQADLVSGANDITKGRFDVAIAESGIALQLKMGPLLNKMLEKELVVTDVHTQMLFDLTTMWFPAYEPTLASPFGGDTGCRLTLSYDERIPLNKKEVFDQVIAMLGTVPPVISTSEARRILTNIGWKFSPDQQLTTEVLDEQSQFLTMQADASAVRIANG